MNAKAEADQEHPRNVLWEMSRIRRAGPVVAHSLSVNSTENGLLDIAFEVETDFVLDDVETDVHDVEPVVLRYPAAELVGRAAPYVMSGRPDFPRDLQHLITSGLNEPAIFCLARTGLQPIYEHTGVEGVIDRLTAWFRDSKTRSYHADGWEPVPVVWPEKPILGYLNPATLQDHAAANPDGGHAYIAARIRRADDDGSFIHAELPIIDVDDAEQMAQVKQWFSTREDDGTSHIPAVFIWGKESDRDEFPYFNTWTDIESIKTGVESAKLGSHLKTAMDRLHIKFGTHCDADMASNRAIILIVGVWRPVSIDPTIVGLSDDKIARCVELRAYHIRRPLDDYYNSWDSRSEVHPFIGMVPPTASTLAAVSGQKPLPPLTLLGAGALGSAFVDYAARGGTTEYTIYDSDVFLAHNLARHRGTEQHIRFGKAHIAADIATQRVQGVRTTCHVRDFLREKVDEDVEQINKSKLVIDATANAQVRRQLSMPWESDAAVLRTEIFHDGCLGVSYFAKLGTAQNLTMMHFQLLAHAEHEAAVKEWLKFESAQSYLDNELILGFGCSSMTTKMPAYKVDAHATSAFAFCKKSLTELSHPVILLNKIDPDGLPCGAIKFCPDQVVQFGPSEETSNWTVLFSEGVCEKLQRLRKSCGPNETGGYLYGGIDESLSQVYVVAASGEPPDTKASPTIVELGPWGQTPWEKSFIRRTKARLAVVGTWHSHPNSPPVASAKDWKTVTGFVAEDSKRSLPTIMAITGIDADRAYVLDPAAQ